MLYGDNFSSFVIILCGPVSLVILLIVLFSCLTSINVWKIYFNKRKIKPLSSIHKVNNDARKCSFKQELHLDTQYYNKQVKEEDSIAKPNMKDIQVTYRKCYTKEVVDRNQLQAECNSDKNTVHAQSQYKVTKHDIKHAVIKSESELKINMEDAFQNLLTERIGNIITEKEIVLVEHKQPIGPPVLINDEPVSKDRTLSHMYRDVDERELAPLSDTGNCEVHVNIRL
ncbi:unnamed protein product [Mytilus coruscus]|uniref:Uncharacterized protein n=1 Tax=Mytilus coruscus TaxID=42192 RepID=A0A6J8ES08_MYTCO|nr:unnamed protein product [Mytilus coruscus]